MSEIILFMHEFPATPVRPAYKALAVRCGTGIQPLAMIDGRLCYASSQVRTRSKIGRSYYWATVVRFLDGSAETMGAAEFGRRAKTPPMTAPRDGG